MDDEIWYLISNWFIYYYVNVFEELDTKRLFRDFVSRLFRSFATLVFVTSCHACFVVLPRLKCFRRLEVRLNCFRSLEVRLNCFRILELRLKCFRSPKLRLNCFCSLELRSTCFRNLELRLFRDFMSRLFRGLPRLFSWLCVTLGYLPSCDCVSTLVS